MQILIFQSNLVVKLLNFISLQIMSDSVAHSFLGTRGYLAPEMLQRQSYNKAIDIWVSRVRGPNLLALLDFQHSAHFVIGL